MVGVDASSPSVMIGYAADGGRGGGDITRSQMKPDGIRTISGRTGAQKNKNRS